MTVRARASEEQGFTIVEVVVAMAVLVVGLLGVMTMLSQANVTTTSNKAREQGVSLQRELVEAARGIPYGQITPTSVVSQIRQSPGFKDCAAPGADDASCSTIGAGGWTVVRRGITYHVTAGVCSVDDPSDKFGQHTATTFCATGGGNTSAADCLQYLGSTGSVQGIGTPPATKVGDCGIDLNLDGTVDDLTEAQASVISASGTDDNNPDDFKRIVTLVRWDRGEGTRYALQSTTIPNPGFSGAPRVLAVFPDSGSDLLTAGSSVSFTVTTNRKAASVGWYVSGTPMGNATDTGGGVQWDFTWDLGMPGAAGATGPAPGEVLDGTYNVGAKAFDTYGTSGLTKWYTMTLDRRRPYQPKSFEAVRANDIVETRWAQSPENDIDGYEVYRQSPSGVEELVCPRSKATSCRDDATGGRTGNWTYYVYAFDGQGRGDRSTTVSIPFDNLVPDKPSSLRADRVGGTVTLTWTPPGNGDRDGQVTKYRVFRDGTAIGDRYFETSSAAVLSFTDTDVLDGPHQYWVAAVDDKGAESAKLGPVGA